MLAYGSGVTAEQAAEQRRGIQHVFVAFALDASAQGPVFLHWFPVISGFDGVANPAVRLTYNGVAANSRSQWSAFL